MNKFTELLKIVLAGRALDRAQARAAMNALIGGGVTDAQAGAFLAALRVRGETVCELVGFAEAMRARAVKVKPKRRPLLDTCGTGGDGSGTFNISTTVAFVAAGAGAAVAKHGNRAVSSRSGSADVLEALGVRTNIPADLAAECVDVAGVGFLFAPAHHPAVARVGQVRRELGTRTVFNLLGPLSNPAGAKRQLLGVYSTGLVKPLAEALKALGSEDAMVGDVAKPAAERAGSFPLELRQLAEFYESPVGRAYVSRMKLISKASERSMMELVPEITREIEERICRRIDCTPPSSDSQAS